MIIHHVKDEKVKKYHSFFICQKVLDCENYGKYRLFAY